MTVNTVFGYNEVIPKSLDLIRDSTPLPQWMTMCTYSLWWILIQRDWYLYQGNLDYLKEQKGHLCDLLQLIMTRIGEDGLEKFNDNEGRFLDWPHVRIHFIQKVSISKHRKHVICYYDNY